jgi:hypothetical protein
MVDPLLRPSDGDVNLSQIASELRETKELLREISRDILRIERRLKALLPGTEIRRPTTKPGIIKDDTSASQLVDELKRDLERGVQIEGRLRGFAMRPDLQRVASLLGMTNAKLPPKDELVRRIATRLRQNLTMSQNLMDRTPTAGERERDRS